MRFWPRAREDDIEDAFAFLMSHGYRLIAKSAWGMGGRVTYRSEALWIGIEWDRSDPWLDFAPVGSGDAYDWDLVDHILEGAQHFTYTDFPTRTACVSDLASFLHARLADIEAHFSESRREVTIAPRITMRAQRLLALPLLLLDCVRATALGPAPYAPSHRDLPGSPKVVAVTDSALASLGLPSLAAASLPPEYRELRISRGQGMVLGGEYPLVRIVESRTEVVGEVIRFRAILSGSGDKVRILRWAARVQKPAAPVDWRRVVTLLDAAGIEKLDAPKYRTAIMDAGDLVVEVLRGSRYRAYDVIAPQLRTDSISREATRIAALVDSLDRLTRDHR